jgi:hypothetical protein
MATVFEPIRPVPPMTTIFMVYHDVEYVEGNTNADVAYLPRPPR